jgi:CDP-diacylglycerol pyrophosphatase
VNQIFTPRRRAVLLAWCHPVLLLTLGLVLAALAMPAHAQGRRDILWDIISNCMGPDAASHAQQCRAPRKPPLSAQRFDSVAAARAYCRSGSDVWAEEPGQLIAIRDIKMCACPDNGTFIHGLAMPMNKVPGVEGPNRPAGIFQFAWQAGLARVGAAQKDQLALAVNSRGLRSQDQLHVHIVRLRPDFAQYVAEHPRQVLRTVHLQDLNEVWREAPLPAEAVNAFHDFGLLITSDGAAGYVLRIIHPAASPEDEYTQWSCPK